MNGRFLLNELGVPPCWRAYFLLLRQKKVAKEKATPGAAPFGFLALLGKPGGCGTRATPSDSPRRLPPAFLRCSALSTGTPKASMPDLCAAKNDFRGQPDKTAKNETCHLATQAQLRIVSPGPLKGAEQRRGWQKKGEDCLRAQPEFRSPRLLRVAQGTGAAGTDPGSPYSLATFFLAKQQESTPTPQARKTRFV